MAQLVKNLPAMQETWVRSLDWEDPLEKGKATLSSILAWRIPWTVLSMGSQRVGHSSTLAWKIPWMDQDRFGYSRFFVFPYKLGNYLF